MSDPAAAPTEQTIYDFGMNNGDDVEYYLKKGFRVVGVDANRELCEAVCRRFPDDIETGRLIVLPVALCERDSDQLLTFYLHKGDHVVSQLARPADSDIHNFEAVEVPGRTASSIVAQYGPPHYIKIDVEHSDEFVLADLFSAGIIPPLISAEAHTAQVFAQLVVNGYTAFTLVDGETVAKRYGAATIRTPRGLEPFSFKFHSAGPFGEDIKGRWEDPNSFLSTLALEGLGWKDIHAARYIPAAPPPRLREVVRRQAAALARNLFAAMDRRGSTA